MQDMQSVLESGTSEFADSGFHSLLISAYDQGAEFLGAVHTARILSETDLTRPELNTLGLQNAQYLIAQRHQQGDLATLSAEVHFDGERTGIMSWLTSPAPMASLEFFSANATIAAAFVVKDPSVIIDEMEQMASKLAEHAEEPRQTSHPMDLELRNAMISSLGGEVALGLDGPTLPVPSWKLVVEVYDELRLQDSIERAIDQINQEAAERDEGFSVQINAADVGSYTGYQISVSVKPGSTAASVQGMLTASYVYMDGYLVAAPSVALVDKAINTYQSGTGLLTDIEFQALVPQDGELNFSAVSFSRVGDLIEDLIEHLPSSLSQEQQEQVKQLNEGTGPSMYSVYAKADSIRIVQKGDTDLPFSLSQLFSLQSMVSGATGQTSLTDIIGDTTQDMLEDNQ
jgi:hypothetical protein